MTSSGDRRYPWESAEPHWRKVELGALEIPAFMVDDASPVSQAVHLFVDVQELWHLRARIAEAGIPADLADVPEDEIKLKISEAVGVEPELRSGAGLDAAEAWVLTAFASIDFFMGRAVQSGDADNAARYGMLLGRCIEFWRWRRQGHDRRSVSRKGSDRGHAKVRDGGQQANSERAEMARRWVAWARRRARELQKEQEKKPARRWKANIAPLIHAEIQTRDQRVEAVGLDCGHEKPRRACFVCSRPEIKTIRNNI